MVGFVNQRAGEMWEQIVAAVDFRDKSVMDLGCGYGDFSVLALEAGALYVTAIDRDFIVAHQALDAIHEAGYFDADKAMVVIDNIDRVIHIDDGRYDKHDIIMCFSVLPYLDSMGATLKWIYDNSDLALIECQYFGDGPGPDDIVHDGDMDFILHATGWQDVEKIGETDVVIRPATRSIWKCKG